MQANGSILVVENRKGDIVARLDRGIDSGEMNTIREILFSIEPYGSDSSRCKK